MLLVFKGQKEVLSIGNACHGGAMKLCFMSQKFAHGFLAGAGM